MTSLIEPIIPNYTLGFLRLFLEAFSGVISTRVHLSNVSMFNVPSICLRLLSSPSIVNLVGGFSGPPTIDLVSSDPNLWRIESLWLDTRPLCDFLFLLWLTRKHLVISYPTVFYQLVYLNTFTTSYDLLSFFTTLLFIEPLRVYPSDTSNSLVPLRERLFCRKFESIPSLLSYSLHTLLDPFRTILLCCRKRFTETFLSRTIQTPLPFSRNIIKWHSLLSPSMPGLLYPRMFGNILSD